MFFCLGYHKYFSQQLCSLYPTLIYNWCSLSLSHSFITLHYVTHLAVRARDWSLGKLCVVVGENARLLTCARSLNFLSFSLSLFSMSIDIQCWSRFIHTHILNDWRGICVMEEKKKKFFLSSNLILIFVWRRLVKKNIESSFVTTSIYSRRVLITML